MCIVFTCGETEFTKQLQGYEGVTCRCNNCGNWSAKVLKRKPWFTFCFIPVLPLSIHGYTDIVCSICRFSEPLERRQDFQAMKDSGGAGAGPGSTGMTPILPQQGSPYGPSPHQGAGSPPPGGWGSPPPGWQAGSPPQK